MQKRHHVLHDKKNTVQSGLAIHYRHEINKMIKILHTDLLWSSDT